VTAARISCSVLVSTITEEEDGTRESKEVTRADNVRAEDLTHKRSLRDFGKLNPYHLQERQQRADTSILHKHKCYADIQAKQLRVPKGIKARN